MTDPLDRAFRATTYRVFAPDRVAVDLRVGARSAALDALLEQHGVREWAFITAWNPGSQPLGDAENRSRQRELLSALRERGLPWLDGSGIPSEPTWQAEESVLVLGLSQDDAIALGTRFGQVAVVVGKLGGAAELVYCDPTREQA